MQLGWGGTPFFVWGAYFVPLSTSGTIGIKPFTLSLVHWFAPVSGGGLFSWSATRVLDFRASFRCGNSLLSGGARSRSPPVQQSFGHGTQPYRQSDLSAPM